MATTIDERPGAARPSQEFSGWFCSATLALLSFRVAVHSDDPALVDAVDQLYSATRAEGEPDHALFLGPAAGPDGPGFFAATDGVVLVRTAAPNVAFRHLVFAANQCAIEATDGLRLHAAAATVPGGGAVVIPGAMGAGKSTLVAGLVRRGCEYLTDEVAVVADGMVRTYPKPLSLGRPPAALGLPAWDPPAAAAPYLSDTGLFPPGALGRVAPAAAPLAAIVLPKYVRGAALSTTRLDAAAALEAVAAYVFALGTPGALAAVAAVVNGVPCLRLEAGDLAEACDAVLEFTGSLA